MADAFRGLTLKLGADARPVASAIGSITKSAGQAQTQLNKLNRALKMDPGNVAAMASKIELVGDKATLAARRSVAVKTAMSQAANEVLKFSQSYSKSSASIEKLAANTKDIYAETNKLRGQLTHVDADLARIYEAAARVKAETDGVSFEKALSDVKKLAKEMNTSEVAARELRNLIHLGTMGSETTLRADFGLSKINNVTASWKIATTVLDKLRRSHNELQHDLSQMLKVEGYKALSNELVAARAEMRSASMEATELNVKLYSLGSEGQLADTVGQLRKIDAALEQATTQSRELSAAFGKMPTSWAAGEAKLRAAEEEMTLLTYQAKAYEKTLAKIKADPAFDKQIADSQTLFLDFVKMSDAVDRVRVKLVESKERAAQYKQKLDELKAAGIEIHLSEVKEVVSDWKKASAEAVRYANNLERAEGKLRALTLAKTARETDTALKGVNARLREMERLSSNFHTIGERMASLRTLGYGLYSTITPAIMIAGRYAIQAAEDIDAAYRDMRKTVNGTEEQFEHLRSAAIEFSRTHVTSADTILEIEAMGGQLGIAAQNLEGFSEVVSNLEIATDIDAEDMAKYIGQLSNIMKDIKVHKDDPVEYQKAITSFSDSLVRLGNNSAAQESSIMKVMMRIASLGTISGFTTPELLAIATAVAATGQGCEAAGTAISKTFSNIEAAVGAGGDSLQAFADVANMSADDFAAAWNEDPMKAFDAFIGGLRRIDEEGGSVDATLTNLKITSVRQKQALMGLANTYDVMTDSLRMSNDAWNGLDTDLGNGGIEKAGDAAREAQRKAEGFSGSLQIMRNNAQALAAELADGAAPIISMLGGLFQGLTGIVSAMPQELKTVGVGFLGVAAAAGPALVAIGAIGAAMKTWTEISAAAAGANTLRSLTSTGSALNALASKGGMAGKVFTQLGMGLAGMESIGYGKIVAGIAGIAAVTAIVADSHMRAAERIEQYKKVTEGLADVNTQLKHSWEIVAIGSDDVAKALDSITKSQREYREAGKDAIKTGAAFHDEINTKLENTEHNAQLLQYYSDRIVELANKSSKSAKEISELQQLVGEYNKLSGSSINVDEMTGALDVQTAAIERNTQAAKLNAYAKAYSDLAAEGLKNVANLTVQYNQLTDDMLTAKAAVDAFGDPNAYSTEEYVDGMRNPLYNADYAKAVADYEAIVKARYETWKSIQEEQKVVDNLFGKQAEATRAANGEQEAMDRLAHSFTDYMMAMENAGVNVDEFANSALLAGMNVEDFAAELSAAGISTQQFAAMGIEGFTNLWNAAGQNIDNIKSAINLLNQAGIDPKTMTVTEEGIEDVDGKLWQLDLDAGTITDGEHTFSLKADTSQAEAAISEAAAEGEGYDEETYAAEVDADNGEAMESYEEAESEGESYDGTTYTASAGLDTSAAYSALNSLKSSLTDFANTTYTAGVSSEQRASGGISALSAIRAVPRFASGAALNGIVTRATMTNRGLVGEAGDEAVFHMRHAGGAIIPLSNRQHVRPFARAVAYEMGGMGGQTVHNYNITLDYKAGDDANKIVRDLGFALRTSTLMEA